MSPVNALLFLISSYNQKFYKLPNILKILKLKITTHSQATYQDDSATILARVHTPDDGRVRPKHIVIRYMKDKNKRWI
jgi:hypothetical protein